MKKRFLILLSLLLLSFLLACSPTENNNNDILNEVTITFNTDGGNEIDDIILNKGDVLKSPDDPIKRGYKFLYWQLDDKRYDFNKEVTENITLKAVWEEIKEVKSYNVLFIIDDDNSFNQSVIEGDTLDKPNDPKIDNYEFVGWFKDDVEFNFDNIIKDDFTLKAKFVKINKIHYYLLEDEYNHKDNILTFKTKDELFVLKEAYKLGYNFKGWYLNDTLVNELDLSIETDYNLTPQFEANQYEISLSNLLTSNIEGNLIEYDTNLTITIKNEDNKAIRSFKINGVELKDEVENNEYSFKYNATLNEFLLKDGEVSNLNVSVQLEELELNITDFAESYLRKEVYAYLEVFVIDELSLGEDHHYIVTDGTKTALVENIKTELKYGDLVELKAMIKDEGVLVLYDLEGKEMEVTLLESLDKIPYEINDFTLEEFLELEVVIENVNIVLNIVGTLRFENREISIYDGDFNTILFDVDENAYDDLIKYDEKLVKLTSMTFPDISEDGLTGLVLVFFNNENLIEIID